MSSGIDDPRMGNFVAMSHVDQIAAIKQLASSGMGDYAIAAALPAAALQRTPWGLAAALKKKP
jgi:hypothetical protein